MATQPVLTGSPVVIANFSLSGWGTGQTITASSGTQRRCTITVVSGSNPTLQPTITFTFPIPYPIAPLCLAFMHQGIGIMMVSDITIQTTPFQAVFTYGDLPAPNVAGIFTFDTLGI